MNVSLKTYHYKMKEETRKRFFSSKDQSWATPQWLFDRFNEVFNFDLDPCATSKTAKCDTYFTKETDGLKQDWTKFRAAYVNPPFGRELPKWTKKCFESASNMENVCRLIPARTDTRYWHNYCLKATAILFIKGRITFEDLGSNIPKEKWTSAFFPSAFIVFGNIENKPLHKLSDLGIWVYPKKKYGLLIFGTEKPIYFSTKRERKNVIKQLKNRITYSTFTELK